MRSLGDIFPRSERVFYKRAPLTNVICQLRFPRILRIESQVPADFQDRVRASFPLVDRTQVQLPIDMPPEVAQAMGFSMTPAGFQFSTEDGKSKLHLSADALSLATHQYGRWEEFCAQFMPALDALIEIYQPSFFQRVGLRYVNMINRAELGLQEQSWIKLLRPEVLAELSVPDIEAAVVDFARNIRIRSEDGHALFFQHGLVKKKGVPDNCIYRLDFDFYIEGKTEVADVKRAIDSLNSLGGRAFRWCITDTLHQHLGPDPIRLAKTASGT